MANPPLLRGTSITAGVSDGSGNISIALPSASAAGDFCVLCYQGDVDPGGAGDGPGSGTNSISPGQWIEINSAAVFLDGSSFYRTLDSTNISTGSVTVGVAGGASGERAVIALAVFIENTVAAHVDASFPGPLRENQLQRASGTFTSPVTGPSTDSSVTTIDGILYFASNGGVSSTDTCNRGTLQQTVSSTNGSGCLYYEGPAAGGVVTPTFTYTTPGSTGHVEMNIVIRSQQQPQLIYQFILP